MLPDYRSINAVVKTTFSGETQREMSLHAWEGISGGKVDVNAFPFLLRKATRIVVLSKKRAFLLLKQPM